MPSVAPVVTQTSVSGSSSMPWWRCWCRAIAWRSAGTPMPGAYWFAPSRSASTARSTTEAGPSTSGNP